MKRYAAIALALVMCASLLVGCGCSGDISVTTEPTTQSTTAPTTRPTTVPTTQPTTQPTTRPTTAPSTSPAEPSTGTDSTMTTDGNMDADRGTIPNDVTTGMDGRRIP